MLRRKRKLSATFALICTVFYMTPAQALISPLASPVRISGSSTNPFPLATLTGLGSIYTNSGPIELYQNASWAIHQAPAFTISLPSVVGNYIDIFEGPSTTTGEVGYQIQYWAGGTSNSQTQYTISSITAANPPVITTSATPTGITAGSQIFIAAGTGSGTVYTDLNNGLGGNFYTVASVSGSNITLASGNTNSLVVSSASGGSVTLVPTRSTQTTPVSYQDGIPVQTGATQWRLIGTVFVGAGGVAGQTEYSAARQLIFNVDTLPVQPIQQVSFAGIGSAAISSQSPLAIYGGPNSPTASSNVPSFNRYDRFSTMGGASNLRPLPTSGSISGDYYVGSNWVQTGTITSSFARIYCAGSMTLNNTWAANTEMSGGVSLLGHTTATGGSGFEGCGFGGGQGFILANANLTYAGGGGGGFGGVGGQGGMASSNISGAGGGSTYPISASLSGSGGGGGTGAISSGTALGVGGAGGGSIYIEALGDITLSSGTFLTVLGGNAATGGASSGAGGGGSGGGIQMRSIGTITISSGAVISANGGTGGTAGTSGAAGGGGGGGVVDLYGITVTNNGSITVSGGSAGTGGTVTAVAGSSGISNLNQFIQGPRSTP
jgi:hypothetical protein